MQYGLEKMGIAFSLIGGVLIAVGTLMEDGLILQAQGAIFIVLGIVSLISSR